MIASEYAVLRNKAIDMILQMREKLNQGEMPTLIGNKKMPSKVHGTTTEVFSLLMSFCLRVNQMKRKALYRNLTKLR